MNAFLQRLRDHVAAGRSQPLELASADWCLRHGGDAPTALAWVQLVRAADEGHSCLRLDHLHPALHGDTPLCEPAALHDALARSPLVGEPGDPRPLIRERGRLYLQRYRAYEAQLAARLRDWLRTAPEAIDPRAVAGPAAPFAAAEGTTTDWQPVAAAVALRHRFSVISGGPGTGKTYTVLRLMQLLLDRAAAADEAQPVIRLAAPTGKAAARMMESVQAGLAGLADAAGLRAALPEEAVTLHRLLGLGGTTTRPRYHADNPLTADAVIVDEASMVDLPLMAKLVAAIPPRARLIMLGDRNQLAAVESGSVLAELCTAAGENGFSPDQQQALAPLLGGDAPPPVAAPGPVADHVVTLQRSRRFAAGSPIGRLARAVNTGDGDAAAAELQAADGLLQAHGAEAADRTALVEAMADQYAPLEAAREPREALQALDETRLLTATRVGPAGSEAMNRRIQQCLARRADRDPEQAWYHGRPVLILRNDYRARLFNGDTGVCLRGTDDVLRVWFPGSDGPRALLPATLPGHETVYAMTVHKSQGSEFRAVTLLLPEADTPLLTRELLYTGITRARERLTLATDPAVLAGAVARRIQRESGLADRLADPAP